MFTIFLGTGCRVSELAGICWSNCDFEKNTILIDHSLTYRMGNGQKVGFRITTPKTAAGIRTIPMLKAIQSIMGHADIQTTMDVYAEATEAKKQASFENLEGKIVI